MARRKSRKVDFCILLKMKWKSSTTRNKLQGSLECKLVRAKERGVAGTELDKQFIDFAENRL